ncbi:hypothetical protein A1O3_04606 [Capronia epimyces CBS 606.96]|uniref:aldehyde dehydrogenase (NAD(+)) n=1 Tax=Capronia epimyces CBS 606.96 TaxID=1182542 RepID=W9YNV3_9EURO|nr:uncharacterized protein A1O3_04606 [Capronia epimyces CBS 606.96]EXJ83939.1 hypothetical protein A1O3_04606 [Capronia epimyces CBS 606.96]
MASRLETVKSEIDSTIASILPDLQLINSKIHGNPESAFKEQFACETLHSFLKSLGTENLSVATGAYGLKTCLEARYRSPARGGRCVNFNAEYDALPEIGHACGHNLIALASLVAFTALQAAVHKSGIAGDIQLLGTPAEEDGGGKIMLLEAGAFQGCDVSLMAHPTAMSDHPAGYKGTAGQTSTALLDLTCTFWGKNAHAGLNPWDGINALDAVVCAYNNISVLRQQLHPVDRIHGAILEAPKVANVIPSRAKVGYTVRSSTRRGAYRLGEKVEACLNAAGLATGCKTEIYRQPLYADLRLNKTLCSKFVSNMGLWGEDVCETQEGFTGGSTDQGNISYEIPTLHAYFGIVASPGVQIHSAEFANAAGTAEAFAAAVSVGKALALVGWEILNDDENPSTLICRRKCLIPFTRQVIHEFTAMLPLKEINISTGRLARAHQLDFSTFFNVIDGGLRGSTRTNHSVNPATKEALAEVPIATKEDVDEAVNAAKTAFHSWAKTALAERKAALEAFASALEWYTQDFAKLMTEESGKPFRFSVEEADSGPYWIRGITKLDLLDEVLDEPERRAIIRYSPLGVVVAIIPWNYPIQLAVVKLAPALLTGNTIILKPSPFAPYCTLKLVELAQQFFPPGVVQGLHGDDDLGPLLTAHPKVDKITFTGSTATGRRIMETASRTLKRVTLELGGNDPAVVCKDVDVSDVAQKITEFAFANSGQVCVAVKRVYIHESIYSEFRAAMVESTKRLRVGDGFEDGVDLGPIQNEAQYNRVCGLLEDSQKRGQKVALEGSTTVSQGFFISPTIIDNPESDARIVLEEPFGPLLPIMSWSTEEEVIHLANSTQMGLGASVWTNDLEEGERIGRQLQAGSVWLNTHMDAAPHIPFGGIKQSGLGVEGGIEGLKTFCNIQTLIVPK